MRTLHLRSPTLERQIRLVRPLGHVASRAAVALSHEIINHLHEEGWPKKPSH
jgi:hypothetical protein